jgi:hypothetical protein
MMSLVSFKSKSNGFIKKIFCEPLKDDYIFVELTESEKNLDWISRKEDQKNLQKDFVKLTKDMHKTILEYKAKNG